MKACVLSEPGHIEIKEMPVPVLEADEMLIRMLVCGTCLSEYPDWKEGLSIGKVMGHEPVGIVEKVGSRILRGDLRNILYPGKNWQYQCRKRLQMRRRLVSHGPV